MDKKALMEELEQLGKLYQAGVFSQAEFEAQRAELLEHLRVLRSGQTPMPSGGGGSGFGQVHGADAFATGFVGGQGQTTGLGAGRVVGERYRLVRMLGRGGTWDNHACNIRSAQRGYNAPTGGYTSIGFRVVRSGV